MHTSPSVYVCVCVRAIVLVWVQAPVVFVRVCVRMNENSNPKLKEAHGRIARTLRTNQAPRDRTLHCAHGWEDGRAGALPALVGGAVAAQATVMMYVPTHATPSYASQPGAWSGQRHPPAAAALLAAATVEE